MRTELLKSLELQCSGFDLDFEISNKLALMTDKIDEISIDYEPRTYAEGKKIGLMDGLLALWTIVRDRLKSTFQIYNMIISIIVCAFNERDTILEVLQGIHDVEFGNDWAKEIIVVDNCSTDGTREMLEKGSWPDTKIIFNNTNLGKSASIRLAIDALSGD